MKMDDNDLDTLLHNIESVRFNNDTVDNGHNSSMSSNSPSFNAEMDLSMNFASSGGFDVSRNPVDLQSNNSLDSVSSGMFNTKSTKTNSPQSFICLEQLNNFYSDLVPEKSTRPSPTNTKVDNLSSCLQVKPDSGKKLTPCVNDNNGENSINMQMEADSGGFEPHSDDIEQDSTSAATTNRNLPEYNMEEVESGLNSVTGSDVNGDQTEKKIEMPEWNEDPKGLRDHTDNTTLPSEMKAGKDLVQKHSEVQLSQNSERISKHAEIFKALDNTINKIIHHNHGSIHGKDSSSTARNNGEIPERVNPFNSLPSISIVFHSAESGEKNKTEMKKDGEYQISAHCDALTIYDGLGDGGPVKFDALMCVAPKDVSDFGLSFLDKLKSWGYRVFLPQRDLNLTGPYHENLARVIRERCNGKVIVVVSKNYPESDECLFLTYFAKQLDPAAKWRSIIPIYIDKEIPKLPNVLSGLSSIRYNEAWRKGFLREKVESALKTDTSGIPPADTSGVLTIL